MFDLDSGPLGLLYTTRFYVSSADQESDDAASSKLYSPPIPIQVAISMVLLWIVIPIVESITRGTERRGSKYV